MQTPRPPGRWALPCQAQQLHRAVTALVAPAELRCQLVTCHQENNERLEGGYSRAVVAFKARSVTPPKQQAFLPDALV